ncbi:MAG: ribbon-helix-helix protein, CopG family [Thermoanaerobaculia bacterium]
MSLKTTVYLDAEDYRRLKAIARAEGKPPASLVRQAVAEFAEKYGKKPRPRSVGSGHSGRDDLSERTEELLKGLGKRR